MITFENMITASQRDDNTPGYLLDYLYFKEYYKIIPIDLSKQQALDAASNARQQINFNKNLDRAGNTTIFFIIKKAKQIILFSFHKKLLEYCKFILL